MERKVGCRSVPNAPSTKTSGIAAGKSPPKSQTNVCQRLNGSNVSNARNAPSRYSNALIRRRNLFKDSTDYPETLQLISFFRVCLESR